MEQGREHQKAVQVLEERVSTKDEVISSLESRVDSMQTKIERLSAQATEARQYGSAHSALVSRASPESQQQRQPIG